METTSRSAVWGTALAVGIFQVVGTFGASHDATDRKGIDAVALLLVLLGPAALAFRDRWPLPAVAVAWAAAAVYIGMGYAYGPIFLSIVIALFNAVQAGRRRPAWVLAAAGYGGYLVATVVDSKPEPTPLLVHMALVAGWLVVVLAVSELVRTRRERVAEQARAEEEEERRRVGEQRLRMAQELHDVLAHNISLINVQAGVALHLIDEQPDQARTALANIKEASRDALHELRTALDILRHGDAPRSPAPRLDDLDALVDGVRAGGLDVRVERRGEPVALPSAVQLAAYRIVQEALTNVTRHARARAVTVRLGFDNAAGSDCDGSGGSGDRRGGATEKSGVTVEVIDDGIGGTPGPGNGIAGMRERAAALGGTVEAGARPGGGFAVTAHLPVDPGGPGVPGVPNGPGSQRDPGVPGVPGGAP